MKSVLLIGLGRFGRHLAMQLNELGHLHRMTLDCETRNQSRVILICWLLRAAGAFLCLWEISFIGAQKCLCLEQRTHQGTVIFPLFPPKRL